MLRFFPNDVASFEPVVALLRHLEDLQQQRGAAAASVPRIDDGTTSLWEAQARAAGLLLPHEHGLRCVCGRHRALQRRCIISTRCLASAGA